MLETIVTRAVELARADAGAIYRYEASLREFRLAEAHGLDPSLVEAVRGTRIRESESAMGEAATARKPIVIADLATIPNYPLRDLTLAAGFHSVLIVPLVGPEEILGSLVLHADSIKLNDGTILEGTLGAPTEVTIQTASGEKRVAFALLPAEVQRAYWTKAATVAATTPRHKWLSHRRGTGRR